MTHIKNNLLALCGCALMLTACSENAWNNHLDGFEEPPVYGVTETVVYNLTAADYSSISSNATNKALAEADGESEALAAVGKNGSFATAEQARKYIPALLASSSFPYFTLNNGSSLRIGYNLATNQPAEVMAINSGVEVLKVSKADYQEVWGSDEDYIEAFAPIAPASASIPTLLANAYPDAEEGDYAIAQYNEADTNPVFGNVGGGDDYQPQTYLEASFAEGVDPFAIDNVLMPADLSYVWNFDERYGCMKASAFANSQAYASESWLVSPELTLGTQLKPVLTFDQALNFFASVETAADEASVNIREVGGEWVRLTVPGMPASLSWTFVASGDIDLSAWAGKNVQIGFRYASTDAKAGTWEVKNVKVADAAATRAMMFAPAAEVPSTPKNAIYVYDGEDWTVPGSMVILQKADYTAMGFSYDNMSGTQPEQYLPVFLAQKFPYAADDAAEIVVYRYYNADKVTGWKASQLTKTNGEWVMNAGQTIDKFTRKGGAWNYNPSVELVLPYARNTDPSYSYYMACLDWVFDNVTLKFDPNATPANGTTPGPAFIDYRGNAEFYSGTSAYYGNVDVRASTAVSNAPAGYTGYDGLTNEQIEALIKKRFCTETMPAALSKLNADAMPVEGMEVTYTVTFTAYTGSAQEETVVYVVTGPGEFKYKSCTWYENGEDADF